MIHQSALPHPLLQRWVDRYWCSTPAGDVEMPALLPGTGAELWFHLMAPPVASGEPLPPAHLVLTRARPLQLQTPGRHRLVAIRFRNTGLFRLLGVPLDTLVDQQIALSDLMPEAQLSLMTALREADSWEAQVTLLDHWLLRCLPGKTVPFERLVERHYYQRPTSHGYSSRQFQRLFRQYTGVSARRFQRLRRFQTLTRRLLMNAEPGYLEQALAEGYYDQAHCIRDFRELTGETPGQFLVPQNFHQHFYLPSRVREPMSQ